MSIKSKDYHDYVIKDNRFIGQFEEMYQNSSEIPWHQDKHAYHIFTDLDITILTHFHKACGFKTICEIGCGLGYVAHRIHKELPGVIITGFDISKTAVKRAKRIFPEINFQTLDILKDDTKPYSGAFDLIITKDLIWYVMEKLELFWQKLEQMTVKYIFISQSFPESNPFYGSDIFPSASAMDQYISKLFRVLYSCVEKDTRYGNRELIHILAEKREDQSERVKF